MNGVVTPTKEGPASDEVPSRSMARSPSTLSIGSSSIKSTQRGFRSSLARSFMKESPRSSSVASSRRVPVPDWHETALGETWQSAFWANNEQDYAGPLLKQSGYMKRWSSKHFVLRGAILYCFRHIFDMAPQTSWQMDASTIVRGQQSAMVMGGQLGWSIYLEKTVKVTSAAKSPAADRRLHLWTASEEHYRGWLEALQHVAQPGASSSGDVLTPVSLIDTSPYHQQAADLLVDLKSSLLGTVETFTQNALRDQRFAEEHRLSAVIRTEAASLLSSLEPSDVFAGSLSPSLHSFARLVDRSLALVKAKKRLAAAASEAPALLRASEILFDLGVLTLSPSELSSDVTTILQQMRQYFHAEEEDILSFFGAAAQLASFPDLLSSLETMVKPLHLEAHLPEMSRHSSDASSASTAALSMTSNSCSTFQDVSPLLTNMSSATLARDSFGRARADSRSSFMTQRTSRSMNALATSDTRVSTEVSAEEEALRAWVNDLIDGEVKESIAEGTLILREGSESDGSAALAQSPSCKVEQYIKAGTPEQLVRCLTWHPLSSADFLHAFLTTYRTFMSSQTLFDLLRDRFNEGVPASINDCPVVSIDKATQLYMERKVHPVQLRVFHTIKAWTKNHYSDFDSDPALLASLEAFLPSLHAIFPSGTAALQVYLERQRCCPGQPHRSSVAVALQQSPLTLATPSRIHSLLHDVDPSALAKHITCLQRHLFDQVTMLQLLIKIKLPLQQEGQVKDHPLHWLFDRAERSEEAQDPVLPVRRMTSFCNFLILWVGTEIVQQTSIRQRAAYLRFWIAVAEALHQLQNYDGLMAICQGLKSTGITRLQKTWHLLSTRTRASFDHLSTLVSEEKNYGLLRQTLQPLSAPALPFLGMYLMDLTKIDAGNKDTIAREADQPPLVNMHKRWMMANVLRDFLTFQQPASSSPSPQRVDVALLHFMATRQPLADDVAIYDASHVIEARPMSSPMLSASDDTISLSDLAREVEPPVRVASPALNGLLNSGSSLRRSSSTGRTLHRKRPTKSLPDQAPLCHPLASSPSCFESTLAVGECEADETSALVAQLESVALAQDGPAKPDAAKVLVEEETTRRGRSGRTALPGGGTKAAAQFPLRSASPFSTLIRSASLSRSVRRLTHLRAPWHNKEDETPA